VPTLTAESAAATSPDLHVTRRHDGLALEVLAARKVFEKDGKPLWRRLLGRGEAASPRREVRAVDDVNLTVPRGEIFGILGSNGSGKSTLIRLISTLLLPDAGAIRVFGHDVVEEEMAVKRLINRVSVDAAFFKKLSPWENLSYAARLYGMPNHEARLRAVEILGQLGIKKKRIDEPLEHMSRGMQQKVAIARAFLTSPILLLLDEPTTGLDPRSKRDVQEFVLAIRERHDATVLLTSHDMGEADRLCDRLAIIDNGKIVALDTPAALKERCQVDGKPATLEDAFMRLTGRSLDDADEGDDETGKEE
jgi:ABC-2 type transport system ATP-binding protein